MVKTPYGSIPKSEYDKHMEQMKKNGIVKDSTSIFGNIRYVGGTILGVMGLYLLWMVLTNLSEFEFVVKIYFIIVCVVCIAFGIWATYPMWKSK